MVKEKLILRFKQEALASGAEVEIFTTLGEVQKYLLRFFEEGQIRRIFLSSDIPFSVPEIPHVLLLEPGFTSSATEAEAGLVLAQFGIAETGSLVHLGKRDEEKLAWMLPPLCLCLLEAEKIMPDWDSLIFHISNHLSSKEFPSPQVSLVTGPSRTADIECELTLGVHGPSRLIILLVEGKKE